MDEPEKTAPRFDLFTRDGSVHFYWRLRDKGIAVEEDGLALIRAGQWTRAEYRDIVSVTLSSAVVGQSAPIALCTITLGNGSKIIVSNVNERGLADGQRDRFYREFVTAFHTRLVETGASAHIMFRSGFGQARMTTLILALAAGIGLFIVLPLIIVAITHEVTALGLAATGFLLLWPAMRIAKVNQPGTYRAANPPDLVA